MSIKPFELKATFIGCGDCEQKAYSSMYADNVAININVVSSGVYYEVSTGLTGGAELNCTFQNGHEIKVPTDGTYFVTWSMSPATTSVANKEAEGAIMINNIASPQGTSHGLVSPGGNNRPITLSGNGIFDLSTNDIISLAIENHTDSTDFVIEHLNCSVFRI